MKKIATMLMFGTLSFGLIASCGGELNDSSGNANVEDLNNENQDTVTKVGNTILEGNIIVFYYSHTGTTKELAERIAHITKGDLFELEPSEPYPANVYDLAPYTGTNASDYQKAELPDLKYDAELLENYKSLAEYDYIFLGTPIWFDDVALPVKAFMNTHDFREGQFVFPFSTADVSSGIGAHRTMTQMIENAVITEVFDDKSYDDESYDDESIIAWITKQLSE